MKRVSVMLAVASVFSFVLAFGASPGRCDPIVLKAASAWPQTHDNNLTFFDFFKMVSKKSNGSLKVEWAGGPELVKARDLPTAAAAGTIDLFLSSPGYYGGIVPEGAIWDAFPAYRNFDKTPEAFRAMLKILEPAYEQKLQIKPIGLPVAYPFYLWTKKSVHTFDDMKGLKIRAHGGLVPFVARALGVTPITMPSEDVYMALERGVIDGAIRNLASYTVFKEYEFAPYGISTPVTWATGMAFISLRKWNQLNEEQRKALMDAGHEVTDLGAKFWKKKNVEYMNLFGSEHVKFYDLPPQEAQEWEKRTHEGGMQGAKKVSPQHADEMIAIFKKYSQ